MAKTQPARVRLGGNEAWLELSRTDGNVWRISADWCSWLTAEFTTHLTTAEALDFADRVLAHLAAASRAPFTAAVTPSRNNPITLTGVPVGDGFAVLAMLTPNGDDNVCRLQMEIDPISSSELHHLFSAFRSSLN
ncbi:hypothetical protein [Yinghuangia seranimata]|uniref:hypothetical protein n=1 Tax=Yinghuangia seranimata TaxID=408067 RepID=UPI00248B5863|nr:hypothetical protein [Yinghuangia seranimata]MDI2129572.1 hypothetical protein [Yinghuangia seranimata]